MGMAASQARLLTITARIHDVEYQAQSIQNAKVQLATQSDQVYNEYLEALDATTLTISTIGSDGAKSTITANFNNLFSHNRVRPSDGSEYALHNDKGKLVVEDDVYKAYYDFKDNDPYAFAAYMLGQNVAEDGSADNGNFIKSVHTFEEQIYQNGLVTDDKDKKIASDSQIAQLRKALENYISDGDIYSGNLKPEYDNNEDREKYEGVLNQYREALYSRFGEDILTSKLDNIAQGVSGQLVDTKNYNQDDFNYYVSIFNQIKMSGGCVPISDYNGMFGDASSNSDWLKSMIECGKFTIDIVSKDKNGMYSMNGTSPSSDTSLSYTTTTTIDSTALKKAEAKYEKGLKDIDKKDKRYDMTLSKLETERQALTTEYNSVKKVIEDNIDRTFGIFS